MSSTENPLARASFNHQRNFATGIRGFVAHRLPRPIKQGLKLLVQLSLDATDLCLGRRRELVPPRYLNFAGDGDFEATGEEFFRYFTELGGLRPSHRILEVGCGIGRMARPLTKYLTDGSYEGIDIVPKGIRWCQSNISRRYANFRFQLADVYNLMYNPRGRFAPEDYRFPFGDGQFDFVFLTSVFTHMLKRDMEHYLGEIARTLRPGGGCFMTLFLSNDESRKLMDSGLSSLNFQFERDGCFTDDARVPEHAVAFEESYFRGLCNSHRLAVNTTRYGAWPGRRAYLSYQDIVLATKT